MIFSRSLAKIALFAALAVHSVSAAPIAPLDGVLSGAAGGVTKLLPLGTVTGVLPNLPAGDLVKRCAEHEGEGKGDVSAGVGAGVSVGAGVHVGANVDASVGAGVSAGAGVNVGANIDASVGAGVNVGAGVGVGAGVNVGANVDASVGAGVSVGAGGNEPCGCEEGGAAPAPAPAPPAPANPAPAPAPVLSVDVFAEVKAIPDVLSTLQVQLKPISVELRALLTGKAAAEVDINAVIRILGSIEAILKGACARVKVLISAGLSASIRFGLAGKIIAVFDIARLIVGIFDVLFGCLALCIKVVGSLNVSVVVTLIASIGNLCAELVIALFGCLPGLKLVLKPLLISVMASLRVVACANLNAAIGI